MRSWSEIVASRLDQPCLLGAEIEPYPFISGYGLLLRITRLTCPERTEIFSLLGLRFRSDLDVLFATQLAGKQRTRFLSAVGLQETDVATYWSEEAWSPLRTDGAFEKLARPVRSCPECAKHGYHTTLFQLPSIECCPWHGKSLSDACARCGQPMHGRFDEQGRLGRCACGNDPFQVNTASVDMWSFPTAQSNQWLSRYLDWAASQRQTRHLIIPNLTQPSLRGFAELARLPQELTPYTKCRRAGHVMIEEIEGPESDEPSKEAFWGWSALGNDRSLTFLPLPSNVHSLLSAVTEQVIGLFPADSPTPVELVTLKGFEEHSALSENIINRSDCFIAPHGLAVNRDTWLNLSAVDSMTLQTCGRLIDRVIAKLGTETEVLQRSVQATRASTLGTIRGRWRLARALERLLCQGYSQGLEAFLRLLLEKQTSCSALLWQVPVVEFASDGDGITAIRICWVRTPGARIRRVIDIPLPVPKPVNRTKRRKINLLGRRPPRSSPSIPKRTKR